MLTVSRMLKSQNSLVPELYIFHTSKISTHTHTNSQDHIHFDILCIIPSKCRTSRNRNLFAKHCYEHCWRHKTVAAQTNDLAKCSEGTMELCIPDVVARGSTHRGGNGRAWIIHSVLEEFSRKRYVRPRFSVVRMSASKTFAATCGTLRS